MDHHSASSSVLSKASIVEWVNDSITPAQHYACVKEIPAKVAAAFMNDIFGDSGFPMRGVNFMADAGDFAVAVRNCDVVLEGARLLGFQPTFTGRSWADGVKDFGGVLLFWRWLRGKSLEKPLSRHIPLSELVQTAAVGGGGGAAAAAAAGASSQGVDADALLSTNARRVVRLSDVMATVGGGSENAGPLAGGAAGPFMCGGPNGEIAKQLFEANFKEVIAMRRTHDELTRAVSEGNLHRIVAVLQQAHHRHP